ncbi:MAG: hypothetical protein ACRC8A_07535 [Microcoleaceae cyanobacterium]
MNPVNRFLEDHPINTILVPQGAEYKAVVRGFYSVRSLARSSEWNLVPIPIGSEALPQFLTTWLKSCRSETLPSNVLLMGVCGSLSPDLHLGEVGVYQSCITGTCPSSSQMRTCDQTLTQAIHAAIHEPLRTTSAQTYSSHLVNGFTSDRVICSALEKRQLYETYLPIHKVDVVDMEGFTVLDILNSWGVAGTILRVVSDEWDQNLPDLNAAISRNGTLQPLPLLATLIQQPLAAAQLIQGSWKALNVLQRVATALGSLS